MNRQTYEAVTGLLLSAGIMFGGVATYGGHEQANLAAQHAVAFEAQGRHDLNLATSPGASHEEVTRDIGRALIDQAEADRAEATGTHFEFIRNVFGANEILLTLTGLAMVVRRRRQSFSSHTFRTFSSVTP